MAQHTDCPPSDVLIDVLLNDADPDVALQTQRHLEACSVCSLEKAAFERSLELTALLPGGPVPPSPWVEGNLRRAVLAHRPFWRRSMDPVLNQLQRPVPTYKALLGGAVLFILLQWSIPLGDGTHGTAISPRAPDPGANPIRVTPVQVSAPLQPKQHLDDKFDTLSTQDFAQAY